jgi:hypothetical protein
MRRGSAIAFEAAVTLASFRTRWADASQLAQLARELPGRASPPECPVVAQILQPHRQMRLEPHVSDSVQ